MRRTDPAGAADLLRGLARTGALLVIAILAAACGGSDAPVGRESAAGAAPRTARQGFHFVDIAAAAGLDVIQVAGGAEGDYIIDTIGSGAAWLDFDGDGDADLYLAQGSDGPRAGPADRLLRNDGDPDGDGVPAFVDVTEASGLGDTLWSFGVAVADHDDDGDPDIYLVNWGPNRLYRNDGDGTFTEIGGLAGVADDRWGVSAAWSDTDHDGDLDLYVANYVEFDFARYPGRGEPGRRGEPPCLWRSVQVYCGPRNLEPAHDVFFRNDGDPDGDGVPSFSDQTIAAGLRTSSAYYGLALLFVDTDNDGDDDLYVANDSVSNMYFQNLGDGTFTETGVLNGLAYNEQGHSQAGMGVAALDYDSNGYFDLAVTNFSHDHDTLYRNETNGTFTDVSYPIGLGGVSYMTLGWGIVAADMDHDGREELAVAHGHVYPQVDGRETGTAYRQPNSLFRFADASRLEEVTLEAGPGMQIVKSSRALLPVDVDGDGDLDLLVTNMNDTPDLLRNDAGAGNWLQVRLEGSTSNRDGIGARVSVLAGGRRQIRAVTRSGAFAGSTLPIAHFGLGSLGSVERIEVRWPSGAVTTRRDVQANRRLLIRETD